LNLDGTDFFFIPILLLAAIATLGSSTDLRGNASPSHSQPPSFFEHPLIGLWFVYGLLLSAAYVNSVYGLGYLTDPVRIVYQLYRYCWKEILLFPLILILFRRADRLSAIGQALIISSVINALAGIFQARSSLYATGLFQLMSKNGFADSMIVPLFFSLSMALGSGKKKQLYQASFLVLLLALLYARSRGALLGFLVGFTLYGIIHTLRYQDKRYLKLLFGLCVLLCAILLVRPEFGQRSGMIVKYGELMDPGEADTFQWRMQKRWPFFIQRIRDNPLLGVGTGSELSFGRGANTPHNGYLDRAVSSGIPSLIVFLTFIISSLRKSFFVVMNTDDEFLRSTALVVVSSLVAICIHAIVDSVFGSSIWILFGLAVVLEGNVKKRISDLKAEKC